MGLLSNTVSLTAFEVVGAAPQQDLMPWIEAQLQQHAFSSIEHSSEELSLGWVELDDFQARDFTSPGAWWRENYVTFSLRRDQRRLPAALVKGELKREQDKFLAQNPTFQRVPKNENEELKELVRTRLLARVLPSPTVLDVLWDTQKNQLLFASASKRAIDDLVDLFSKSFTGLRLVVKHPAARARSVVPAALVEALNATLTTAVDAPVTQQIEQNAWLGHEFLLWLMYQTTNSDSAYRVACPGPAAGGEPFRAWLDERMVLGGSGSEGVQKVTVSGPQDNFEEVCVALRQEKQMSEATIYLDKYEHQWRTTLKGELFQFGSFKCPAVKIDKSAAVEDEQQAVFYERIHVLEEGLQLFDSLLRTFLERRLGSEWENIAVSMRKWLDEC
ncbi:MAG: recombination-associated protein RdgC [Desulfuromonas sp.]